MFGLVYRFSLSLALFFSSFFWASSFHDLDKQVVLSRDTDVHNPNINFCDLKK